MSVIASYIKNISVFEIVFCYLCTLNKFALFIEEFCVPAIELVSVFFDCRESSLCKAFLIKRSNKEALRIVYCIIPGYYLAYNIIFVIGNILTVCGLKNQRTLFTGPIGVYVKIRFLYMLVTIGPDQPYSSNWFSSSVSPL